MGNCATCCGNTQGNEISTEKTVTRGGAKGVQQENNYGAGADIDAAYPANGMNYFKYFHSKKLQAWSIHKSYS